MNSDHVMMLAEKAPMAESAAEGGLEGNLKQGKVEQKIKPDRMESARGRAEGVAEARV